MASPNRRRTGSCRRNGSSARILATTIANCRRYVYHAINQEHTLLESCLLYLRLIQPTEQSPLERIRLSTGVQLDIYGPGNAVRITAPKATAELAAKDIQQQIEGIVTFKLKTFKNPKPNAVNLHLSEEDLQSASILSNSIIEQNPKYVRRSAWPTFFWLNCVDDHPRLER